MVQDGASWETMNILVSGLVHVHMLYVSESAFCMCVSVSEGVDGSWQGLWSLCVSTCVSV